MPINLIDVLFTRLCQFGINSFKDDDGDTKVVSLDQLLQTIEGSRISFIIFSKCYADSRDCLDNLVKVVEWKHLLVLPVFYDIDSSHVHKQTGTFSDALARQEVRHGIEKVEKWKAALTKVANLSGWHLENIGQGTTDFTGALSLEGLSFETACRYFDSKGNRRFPTFSAFRNLSEKVFCAKNSYDIHFAFIGHLKKLEYMHMGGFGRSIPSMTSQEPRRKLILKTGAFHEFTMTSAVSIYI
ncbi:hypothetical protein BC332_11268 [Capsicum chinense]|nr:hypothetical protein BC332_11268 [Capsicum chinense]